MEVTATTYSDNISMETVAIAILNFNGKNHLEIGYLPCRVLKAISYGKIGITDSIHVKNILKEHVIYDKNMEVLFEIAIRERNNYEKIVSAMKYIEENHTYVQRARDLIRALMC